MAKTEPRVRIETSGKCEVCGKTGHHTHGQSQHRAAVDQAGARMREKKRGR